MTILQLFSNLAEYHNLEYEFSESLEALYSLEFEETGLQVKQILESVYKDGITGLENVVAEDGKVTGIFLDRVASGLTKRFKFEITENEITYEPEDPDAMNFTEVDFATVAKEKKCVKGMSCGNGCVPLKQTNGKPTKCRSKPPREVTGSVAQVLAKAAKAPKAAKGSVEQVQKKATKPTKQPKNATATQPRQETKQALEPVETRKPVETKKADLDKIEQVKKTAQAIKDKQEKEATKEEKIKEEVKQESKVQETKQEQPKTQQKAEETKPVSKKYPLDDEKDFEDAVLNKFAELSAKYNGLVPIYQLRRELGETVPRDKFNNYMLNMQGNDLLLLQGGSVEDSARDKIADSVHTELNGTRTYARLGEALNKESLSKRVADTKDRVNEALKDKKPLSELGTAGALANAPKIKNQKEFDDAVEEASNRLNNEFIMGGIVPLEKIRKSLGDRISKEEFDTMIFDYIDKKDLGLGEQKSPTKEELQNGVKDPFGETKTYLAVNSNENKSKDLIKSKYPKSPEERFGDTEKTVVQETKMPKSKKEASAQSKNIEQTSKFTDSVNDWDSLKNSLKSLSDASVDLQIKHRGDHKIRTNLEDGQYILTEMRDMVDMFAGKEDVGDLAIKELKDSKGNTQAMVAYNDADKDGIYIDYLVTAPWNISGDDPRTTKGAGTEAILGLIELSKKKGYGGKITLEALPRAVGFYEKLGFVQNEDDENMTLSPEKADQLLNKLGRTRNERTK